MLELFSWILTVAVVVASSTATADAATFAVAISALDLRSSFPVSRAVALIALYTRLATAALATPVQPSVCLFVQPVSQAGKQTFSHPYSRPVQPP